MAKKPSTQTPSPDGSSPRRVPLEPVDALGRTVARLPRSALADLVEEWKCQALSLAYGDGVGNPHSAGFSLRLGAGFLLVVMVAGAPLGVLGWAATLLSLLSVLLVQVLPHALWARATRRRVRLVLSARGSSAEISGLALGASKSFLLSALGTLANVLVGLALLQLARRGWSPAATGFLSAAAVAHMSWGAAQALPLTPFRAGQAVAARLAPGLRFAYATVSFACVLSLGGWALRAPGFPAFFSIFVLATIASTSALHEAFRELRDHDVGVVKLAAEAEACLRADQPGRAFELAQRALKLAVTEPNRASLWNLLAWSAIGKRDPFTAHAALSQLQPAARGPHLVAAYLACCNRNDEAVELLQEARCRGYRSRETTKLFVDLLFQRGERVQASEVVAADRALLTAHDLTVIDAALEDAENGTPTKRRTSCATTRSRRNGCA